MQPPDISAPFPPRSLPARRGRGRVYCVTPPLLRESEKEVSFPPPPLPGRLSPAHLLGAVFAGLFFGGIAIALLCSL